MHLVKGAWYPASATRGTAVALSFSLGPAKRAITRWPNREHFQHASNCQHVSNLRQSPSKTHTTATAQKPLSTFLRMRLDRENARMASFRVSSRGTELPQEEIHKVWVAERTSEGTTDDSRTCSTVFTQPPRNHCFLFSASLGLTEKHNGRLRFQRPTSQPLVGAYQRGPLKKWLVAPLRGRFHLPSQTKIQGDLPQFQCFGMFRKARLLLLQALVSLDTFFQQAR